METNKLSSTCWEMTVTLDNVACLLHISIERKLMTHDDHITYELGIYLMTNLLGASMDEVIE